LTNESKRYSEAQNIARITTAVDSNMSVKFQYTMSNIFQSVYEHTYSKLLNSFKMLKQLSLVHEYHIK